MKDTNDVIEIDFMQIFEIIRKYLLIFISICLLCATLGFCYAKFLVAPRYSASTKVIIVKDESSSSGAVTYSDLTLSQRLASTYKQIIMSEAISAEVVANINEETGNSYSVGDYNNIVSVSSQDNTEVLNINATANDPVIAADFANETVDVFMSKIYSIFNIQNVTVLSRAKVPTDKTYPSNFKFALIGGGIGALICAGIVLIIMLTDTKVKTEEDVKKIFDCPIIGLIPDFEIKEDVEDEQPNNVQA